MFRNYQEIVAIPGALKFSIAGLIARLPIAVLGLGIVLFIQGETGSYGLAGTVTAVFMVVQALANPGIAKLVDRYGQARVMVPVVVVHIVSLALMVTAVYQKWWLGILMVFAGLSGASVGSLGSMVRARWSYVVSTPKQLQTAFSWEAVADELLFVSGPVLVTFLATTFLPPAGIMLSVIATIGGSLWFYSLRASEPPPARKTVGIKGKVLSNSGILTVIFAQVSLGVNFGAIDVIAVAFADEQGVKPMAGVLLSSFAFGSLIAGAIYGGITFKSQVHHRFLFTLALLAIGTSLLPLAHNLLTFGLILFCVGFTIAPTLIGASSVIEQLAPPRRLTEALAWIGTSLGFGVAFGSFIAGHLIDTFGAHTAMFLPGACGITAAVLVLILLRRMNPATHSHRARNATVVVAPTAESGLDA